MSQKESGRKITLSELRKQYPNIPWASFLNLINKVNLQNLDAEEIDILHLLLKDNDKEAQKKAIEEQAVISERLHTLSASMLHRELRIKVPTNVDLDHTQAYLVYGFIIPSSSRTLPAPEASIQTPSEIL